MNKQTLHYFLKLSVTAELERADFNNWNSSVLLFISWIYKQKVERSKTIVTGKKKDRETQGQNRAKQETKLPKTKKINNNNCQAIVSLTVQADVYKAHGKA